MYLLHYVAFTSRLVYIMVFICLLCYSPMLKDSDFAKHPITLKTDHLLSFWIFLKFNFVSYVEYTFEMTVSVAATILTVY